MKFDLSEAADMREAGIPVRAIAEKVGCSSSLVRQRLREVNPQRLKPGERRKLPRRYFDLETARQMREGGSSVKAIAEVLKFSSTIVRERLKEAGIDGPTKPRKSFDMERATALREGGSTIAEIAAATGIDGSTVHKRLAKAGVPVPPPKPRAPRVRPKFEPKITSPADTPPNPKRKLLNNPDNERAGPWPIRHEYGTPWARSLTLPKLHSKIRLMSTTGIPVSEIHRISGLDAARLDRMLSTHPAV